MRWYLIAALLLAPGVAQAVIAQTTNPAGSSTVANPSTPGLSAARYQALVDTARAQLETLMNRVEKTECCNSKNAFFNEVANQCIDALTLVASPACSN
jgi:hypothetical protein